MKIAFIVTFFPTLSETFFLNQITGLLDMGCDVQIFARYRIRDERVHPCVEEYRLMQRVTYFRIPENQWLYLLKAISLAIINFCRSPVKILKSLNIFRSGALKLLYFLPLFLKANWRTKFDIIFCGYGLHGMMMAPLKKLCADCKLVTAFHGHDMSAFVSRHGQNVYKTLFLQGDLFMPISRYWKKKLITMGCPERKIIVHRMGIDLDKFLFLERKISHTVWILSVGRLVEKKGFEYAIRAVARLAGKNKKVEYIIAGDGPLMDKLKGLVLTLGVEDRIKFSGKITQDEVMPLYRKADIFLLPSVTARDGDQEGIPVALMEAMATGLPVVSSRHSGIPELVEDGVSGFLVEERDVESLTEKIDYLIRCPGLRIEMGRNGRAFVEKNHDAKELNNRLMEIYNKLILME